MTPEHLEHLEELARIQRTYTGIVEFECRGCEAILIYHASVVHSPLVDGLCDDCLAAREDQVGAKRA